MVKDKFEYYVGHCFWRLNKTDGRVGVFTRMQKSYCWDESDQVQSIKTSRFDNSTRWISREVLLKEATGEPFQVKNAKVMRAKGAYSG